MERTEVRVLFVARPCLRSMNYVRPSHKPSISYNISPPALTWATRLPLDVYVLGPRQRCESPFLPEHVGGLWKLPRQQQLQPE